MCRSTLSTRGCPAASSRRAYPALVATPLSGPNITSSEHDAEQQDRRRGPEETRIDPIQDAAVPRQKRAHVLDPDVSLEQRLREVTERRRERDHEAERDRGQPAPFEHAHERG